MAGHPATTWLLTYAAHSALLTALAAVFERTAWGAASERRDAVWKLALVGGIASATVFVALGSAPSGAAVGVPAAVVTAPQAGGVSGIPWVTLIWIAVTAALALRAVRAWRAGVRGAGRRRAIRRGAARAALDAILGPDAGRVVLTCSRTLGVPVAFRREICVPVRALRELPHDELRALLAHEAAHVVRHDAAWLIVSALVRTLGWWQPLNFVAASRLRLAMELCCDERAAIGQPERDALARCLVKVAGWNVRDDGAALAAIASGGPALRRRLSSLLDERPCAQRPRPWLAVAAVTVPAIWLAPMIVIADVARLPAAAARLVPRALTSAASISLPTAPAPAARPTRRKEPVQPAATRVDPLPPADAGEGSPHPEDTGPPAVAVLPAMDPPAAQSTLVAPTAHPSLRAAIAAARVAPAPPPPNYRYHVPNDELRVLPWIGYLRSSHSFDPNRPTFDIR
jgi:beta-lactamase regulating signal transducer with metallopeptidase domain